MSLISPEPKLFLPLSALSGDASARSSARVTNWSSPAAARLVGCSRILSPAAGVPERSNWMPCPATCTVAGGVVPVASEVRLPSLSTENTS